GPEIFDRRNELSRPERSSPAANPFANACSRNVIECGRGFGVENDCQWIERIFVGQFYRYELHAEVFQSLLGALLLRRTIPLEVADLERGDVSPRRPGKRPIDGRDVVRVGAVDCTENQRAIFDRAGDRAELVHAPRERHAAVAADAAKRRPQAAGRAAAARRDDAAERFAADGETDETRDNSGS